MTLWITLVYMFLMHEREYSAISSQPHRCQPLEQRIDVSLAESQNLILFENSSTELPLCLKICAQNINCLSFIRHDNACIYLKWILRGDRSAVEVNRKYYEKSVMKNVAHGRHAEQSSTYHNLTASLAVDGDISTIIHTAAHDSKPWWKVDLENEYWITEVRFLPVREIQNPNYKRLQKMHIYAYDSENGLQKKCGFYVGPPLNADWVNVQCQPFTNGRFVKISKDTLSAAYLWFMELREVEISAVLAM